MKTTNSRPIASTDRHAFLFDLDAQAEALATAFLDAHRWLVCDGEQGFKRISGEHIDDAEVRSRLAMWASLPYLDTLKRAGQPAPRITTELIDGATRIARSLLILGYDGRELGGVEA